MGTRLLASAGVVVIAGAVTFTVVGGASGDSDGNGAAKLYSGTAAAAVVAPPSERDSEPVEVLQAETDAEPGDGLVLSVPDDLSGWDDVKFSAEWTTPVGAEVQGTVDLQRVDGKKWETVDQIEIGPDGGSAEVKVDQTGIYRLAYGGSDDVDATVSNDVTVAASDPLPSLVTGTATAIEDGKAEVTAAWSTKPGVAIVGDLKLQMKHDDDGWKTVSTVTTEADSTAKIEIEAEMGDEFRFVYPGGDRFAKAKSDTGVVLSDDVRNIQVDVCETSSDVDYLPNGVGCHYKPVSSGVFVAAHDYLGNAWWNSMPMGTLVELEGELPGMYEVVDRVIAPGRGEALGAASNWTCGEECDVILQTCQGANTGFTWLRKIDEAESVG